MTTDRHEERCPACGQFIPALDADDPGFGDVEPGGCRGTGGLVYYCNEACADTAYYAAHFDLGRACTCEP